MPQKIKIIQKRPFVLPSKPEPLVPRSSGTAQMTKAEDRRPISQEKVVVSSGKAEMVKRAGNWSF